MYKRNKKIRINCDLGEGLDNDAALMPFIHQANIACGGHAGDPGLIRATLLLCEQYNVEAGAHPSFADRLHFGRVEQTLSDTELYELVADQLRNFMAIAAECKVTVHHVKPHGALYNLSARQAPTAAVIARVIRDIHPGLTLLGLSGSHSLAEAEKAGLRVQHEAFADRSYQPDGSLTPRHLPGALLESVEKALAQVRQLTEEGSVTATDGTRLPLKADTICIHGDGPLALDIAKALYELNP